MKRTLTAVHIILAILAIFIGASNLQAQYIDIQPEVPELVPYRIVPIDIRPGDCNLEVGIELIHPYHIIEAPTPQQQETLEIIYKRIGYEIVNPNMSAGLFHIDGKLYHLIRIPYTGTIWDENN
jgi:hypothetical protein|tara:strand:+ start:646 stop:1017 length:372 start_codon:yes stop_codon:yes gene_type:complete